MQARTVEVFFDVVSPYAYLGLEIVRRYAGAWALNVAYTPFFLGGAIMATKNTPPANVPTKAKYMEIDVRRSGDIMGMPVIMPDNFREVMFGTLKAQRVLTALAALESGGGEKETGLARVVVPAEEAQAGQSQPQVVSAALAMYKRTFGGEGKEMISDEGLRAALIEGGVDDPDRIEALLVATGESGIKDALAANTQRVVDAGSFGGPTFLIHNSDDSDATPELIFGSDRFHHMAHLLGGGRVYSGPGGPGPQA